LDKRLKPWHNFGSPELTQSSGEGHLLILAGTSLTAYLMAVSTLPPTDALTTEHSRSGVRRFNRAAWLTLVLSLAMILFSTAQKAYRLTLPTDGWTPVIGFESDNPAAEYNRVLDKDMFGLPTPLRSGDELLAVEGQDVTNWEERGTHGEFISAPPNWQAGQTVQYTVRRNGEVLMVDAPIRAWTLTALVYSASGGSRLPVYAILPGVLLACFVFWKRPRHLTAQLMLLEAAASLMLFISWLGSPGGFEEYFTSPLLGWVAAFCSHLIPGLVLAPLGLAVVLSFPPRYSLLPRYPIWSAALLIGVPLAAFIILITSYVLWAILVIVLLSTLLSLAWLLYTLVTIKEMPGRAQVRWLALAFGVGTVETALSVMVIFGILPPVVGSWVEVIPTEFMIDAAIAIAILRYNLFDIDLIINRTLVYGTLTALVIGLYIFVVGYLSALFRVEGHLFISLAATGLVAVLFQPLHVWLQRGVNRLMYGRRDEPVTVLTQLGERLESTVAQDEFLSGLVETVTQALKLPYAAIALKNEAGQFRPEVEAGQPRAAVETFPLIYQGETIGQLWVTPRASGDVFNSADRLLLENIARQAGTAVYAARLTAALQQSRQQIITAREEERRRLRRDLHDGLGPQLASQTLTIDAITKLLATDPATALELLQSLKSQARAAIQDIRRLVYDLRPPALDELGLVEALQEAARQYESAGWGVSILASPTPLPSLPAAVEVAVYRIVREAITNATRHAQTHNCTVRIEVQSPRLWLSIADDGPGFADVLHCGVGLTSMRERAEELGGQIVFGNKPEGGAQVQVWLPLPEALA